MDKQITYKIDVSERTFAREVLERSHDTPVVVDFWAAWCQPCRVLGPILERLAARFEGQFVLAKVNVDENPRLAAHYGIQGIPAVKAFRNGKLASEFVGVMPEAQVRTFIERLIPSPAERLTQTASEFEAKGDFERAAEFYRWALSEQPDSYAAMLGLGRVLLSQGEVDEALQVLGRIVPEAPQRRQAEALMMTASFHRHADGHSEAELRRKLAEDAGDATTRYALASLLATQQRYEEALEHFLEVVRRDRRFNDDGARKAMLAIFAALGDEHPLTRAYYQKLANTLY